MKASHSIRWRILGWYALFLVLGVSGAGLAVYQVLKSNEQSLIELRLDREIDDLLSAMRPYVGRASPLPSVPPGPGEKPFVPPDPEKFSANVPYPYYYAIWQEGRLGAVSPYQPPGLTKPDWPEQQTQGRGVKSQRTRGEFREAYEFSPGGRHIYVIGRSIRVVEAKLHTIAWIIAASCAGVIAFGLAVGWWVIGLILGPLSQISAASQRISSGDLSDRIKLRGTGSELEGIATALNDAFSRLESAVEHEANFTSDAAHELRTPVSVLLAETQLALDQPTTTREEAMASIAVCRRAAQRMQALIESLLDLSVIEGNVGEAKRERCDLAEIARSGLEIMQHLAVEKSIRLASDLAAAPCTGDPERLLQIVLNLLSNALKFSPADTEVTVTTRVEGGHAILAVCDTGRGIGAEQLPHVFERFYRVDGSRARASGGAGLGLAICQSIAKSHDGTLTAESVLGQGSTFTLSLPAS
ncbi:N/A [soil metagenome]